MYQEDMHYYMVYHFTLSGEDGKTLAQYKNDNVSSVAGNLSPQLQNLLNASNTGNPDQPCAKYQFLGEFLHAYADTFSHRDGYNKPFDSETLGLGIGHGGSGSEPDYTYNGDPKYAGNDPIVIARMWNVREERTLQAEKAIFGKLAEYGSSTGLSVSEIESTLIAFNKIEEHGLTSTKKLELLQDKLNSWILLGKLKLTNADGVKVKQIDFVKADVYDTEAAKANREKFIGSLSGQETRYPGVCLPGSKVCQEVKF